MSEQWKPIIETDDYFAISSYGRVKRLKASDSKYANAYVDQILKARPTPVYLTVWMMFNGKRVVKYVHLLVAKYFIGPCPKGKEVNHKDLHKCNNYYKNLEYMTHKKNIHHARQHGHTPERYRRHYKGNSNPNSKLRLNDVMKIRKLYKIGKLTCEEIGNKFGVSRPMVSNIIKGRSWSHV